jgi:hypothetical protein
LEKIMRRSIIVACCLLGALGWSGCADKKACSTFEKALNETSDDWKVLDEATQARPESFSDAVRSSAAIKGRFDKVDKESEVGKHTGVLQMHLDRLAKQAERVSQTTDVEEQNNHVVAYRRTLASAKDARGDAASRCE